MHSSLHNSSSVAQRKFPEEYRGVAFADADFNCLIIDPPFFGMKTGYPMQPEFYNRDAYERWLHEVAAISHSISSDDALLWFFGYWPKLLYLVPDIFEREGWKFGQDITIAYHNSRNPYLKRAPKHYECFCRTSESILLFRKQDQKSRFVNKRRFSNVWRITKAGVGGSRTQNYPGKKEEAIIERVLRSSGDLSTLRVLDPMAGSGTTLDVCRKLGVPAYCADVLSLTIIESKQRQENSCYFSAAVIDKVMQEGGISQREIADKVGMSVGQVSKYASIGKMLRELQSSESTVVKRLIARTKLPSTDPKVISINLCHLLAQAHRKLHHATFQSLLRKIIPGTLSHIKFEDSVNLCRAYLITKEYQ